MSRVARAALFLFLVGLYSSGQCAPTWTPTNPPNGTGYNRASPITCTGSGTGTPNGTWNFRAYCQKEGGGYNMGSTGSGIYWSGYEQPPSNGSSLISINSGTNGYHKQGTNTITFQVDDGGGLGFENVGTRTVNVIP
jgi:hypothetical protein